MAAVIYTNWLIPKGMAGFTPGPFSLIQPAYKGDVGLHVHEAVHRAQFWHSLGMALPLAYLLSRRWRLKLELEAYKAQIGVVDAQGRSLALARAAQLLALPAYHLALSVDEAERLLAL